MRKFTQEEDDFIRENYLTIPTKRISKILGRSDGYARQRMRILGLVVPPEVKKKFIEDSFIKKGSISFNKGKRQEEYMSKEAIYKTMATRFKKGQLPTNTSVDVTITIRSDKRGFQYKFIRVEMSKWVPLARYTWEQAHGKIGLNMKVVHKDGDTLNCDLSNLELLTSAELMKRNSYHNLPPEITQTIHLSAVLTRKINKKIKTLNEKQNQ